MKISFRIGAALFLVINFMISPLLLASGNPIPGRWEKVSTIKPGTPIRIYTKDGVIQKCRFESLDDKLLTCTSGEDNQFQVVLETIDKVTLYKRGKFINWGGLIGLGGGIVSGAAIAGSDESSEADIIPVMWGAAIGLVVGSVTGAAIGSPETIYISNEAALRKVQQ